MIFNKNYKKISLLLIVSILSVNISFFITSKKVDAQFVVTDPGAYAFFTTANATALKTSIDTTSKNLWDFVAKYIPSALAKEAVNTVLSQITKSLVTWINSGFQGQPSFVADPSKFLSNTADKTIGDMIFNDPSLNYLCSPFQLQVKIALGLNLGAYQPFQNEIKCTYTGAVNNLKNAISSANLSIVNGPIDGNSSWDDWLSIVQNPANDPIGAYLEAKTELDAKIVSTQNSKTLELGWGQGSLTFNSCTKTTYNSDNTVRSTETITGSTSYDSSPTTQSADGSYTKISNCTAKTPGAIITNMLGFSATEAQRSNELEMTLATGLESSVNQIFSALAQYAMQKITSGILDTSPSAAQSNYDLVSLTAASTTMADYTAKANMFNSGVTDPTALWGLTVANQATTSANVVNYNDPFAEQRWKAGLRINSLIDSENAYQLNLNTDANILKAGRDIFAKARACDYGYSNPTIYLRGQEIQSNVIDNIDGTNYSGTAPIDWSLEKISKLLTKSNTNLDFLNTESNALSSAQSSQAITDVMTQVNSKSDYNTNPEDTSIDYVKNFLNINAGYYSQEPCTIDVSYVLKMSTSTQINLIATSTTSTSTPN